MFSYLNLQVFPKFIIHTYVCVCIYSVLKRTISKLDFFPILLINTQDCSETRNKTPAKVFFFLKIYIIGALEEGFISAKGFGGLWEHWCKMLPFFIYFELLLLEAG